MKIKISEVDKMIKEEFQKMMEKKKLLSKLSQIDEQLSQMDSEDSILNEVEAGGKTSVASHAWTGEAGGDTKWKPEFEKKGTHLKEDDIASDEPDMSPEGPEMGSEGPEMNSDEPDMEVEMGEFESKFAEIGRAIDAKLASEGGAGAAPMGEPAGEPEMGDGDGDADDDFEEVEVNADEKGGDDEIEEDVNAKQHLNPNTAMASSETGDKLKGEVQESVDEPLEGHSVAQEAPADDVNDNLEKDTHVKEGAKKDGKVITEAKTPAGKNIFTEGVDEKKKTAMLNEINRMRRFAGLSKEEE